MIFLSGIAIGCFALGIWIFFRDPRDKNLGRQLEGAVEKIELTFGAQGQQIMTIDGKQYCTWISYENWPEIGQKVTHVPYKDHDGRGGTLYCTRIV